MLSNYGGAYPDLRPSDYTQGDAMAFAEIVRRETERGRTRRGGNQVLLDRQPMGLLGPWSGGSVCAADLAPWFELLTNLDVIEAVADQLSISLTATLTAIIEKLCPPNWQTFFWMRAYVDRLETTLPVAEVSRLVSLQVESESNQAAKYRGRRSGEARREQARAKPELVYREFDRLLQSGEYSEAEAKRILAERFHVTTDNIRKILRKRSPRD